MTAFLKSQTGELSDEELDNAAGGGCCDDETVYEAMMSTASFGIYCAVNAAGSAATGHVGQQTEEEGRLCH